MAEKSIKAAQVQTLINNIKARFFARAEAQTVTSTDMPEEVTEQTVAGWGFTKNTGTYSKPSSGIPKTDMASAVQTSLGRADSALQSVPDTYRTASAQDAIDATKLSDAPADGKQYARKNGSWAEVESGGNQYEITANKVTSLSSSSTDTQYPSAKAVYDFVSDITGNIESLLAAL